VGAVFGALPGNSNSEIAEDQKRGQESRGDEPVTEAVIVLLQRDDVATDQSQSHTSIMLGGNDKLNLSAHAVPIKQEVLQLESFQFDKKKQFEEGECARQGFADKHVADSAPLQPVADTTLQPVAGNAPIQVTTASPATKESLVCSSNTEVEGRTECKTQELSCSVFPDADPSVVRTEQLSCEVIVKAEKVAETADVGCALGPDILHPHHALQESHHVASNLRDDIGDEVQIDSHVHWEHGDLKIITDQHQEQDLEIDRDQGLEGDQDLESEQHFSYIESDYDGERRSYEQCPARNMKVLGHGPVICSVAIRIKYGICTLWHVLNRVRRGCDKLCFNCLRMVWFSDSLSLSCYFCF
jgi:hypothetical protein